MCGCFGSGRPPSIHKVWGGSGPPLPRFIRLCGDVSQPILLIVGLVFVLRFSLLVVVYLLTKEGRRDDADSRLHDGFLFPFGARPLWHAFVFHGQIWKAFTRSGGFDLSGVQIRPRSE